MQLTKHNVCQYIEDTLKSKKIRYSIEDCDSKGCLYELYTGYIESFIQVEYNLDNDDSFFYLQIFTEINDNGLSLYHSEYDNYDNESDNEDIVENEIDELLNSTNILNKGISKIQIKIEEIKDICDEYGMVFEEFIHLEYNFD